MTIGTLRVCRSAPLAASLDTLGSVMTLLCGTVPSSFLFLIIRTVGVAWRKVRFLHPEQWHIRFALSGRHGPVAQVVRAHP